MKTSMLESFSLHLYEEAQLEMVKVYFSQAMGLFSLSVMIEDKKDSSLVYHKVYPPHTVA